MHRRVFFIAGFDPKTPRFYHRLYRNLAANAPSGPANGHAVTPRVGQRNRLNDLADEWDVYWPSPGEEPDDDLHTRYTVLRWDDVVRAHWQRGLAVVLRDHWNFYVDGHRQGAFGRTWRASRLNWVFVMFPLFVTLAIALLVVGTTMALLATLASDWSAHFRALLVAGSFGLGTAAWLKITHRLGSDWLMRLYGFSHAQAEGRVQGLEQRVDEMASLIAQAVRETPDAREVLIVGHSTGATLAASALSRAMTRAPDAFSHGPEIALLTLGHCTPLVYFFATAQRFRDELDALTGWQRLTWVDYTAPADWAGCGRMTPWYRAGPAALHRLTPRFPKILTPDHYRALRRNRLAMHMQYLKPADIAGRYDLLAFTAGPKTLRQTHPPPGDDIT